MKKYMLVLCFGLVLGRPQNLFPSSEQSPRPAAKILFLVGLAITGFFIYKKVKSSCAKAPVDESSQNNPKTEEKQKIDSADQKVDNKPIECPLEKLSKVEIVHIEKENKENKLEVFDSQVPAQEENILMRFLQRFKKYFHI